MGISFWLILAIPKERNKTVLNSKPYLERWTISFGNFMVPVLFRERFQNILG
jgi:hypothetical protein